MIKHTTCILLTFLLLAGSACEKQLDISSVTNLTNATYYKTPEDAKAALGACYKVMGVWDPFPDLVMSDDAVPFLSGAADRVTLWRYNLTPSNSFLGGYASSFGGINRSNIVIARVPDIPMDENLKKRYIAEAKVLRALHYFNLVRIYGGVPVTTTETASLEGLSVPRNTVEEVYAQIEKDLKESEDVLPPSYPATDGGRVTSGAAKGLLAKVYLTRAGTDRSSPYWAQAAAKAKEVMDQGVYGLYDNYADAFALTARGGKENMLEVQYLTDVYGHGLGRGYGPRAAPIFPGGGSAIARPTQSLYNSYTANDKRKAVTFMTSYVYNGVTTNLSITDPDPAKAVSFQKLWDRTAKTNGGEGTSRVVLRYADVLLIYAEAANEANGSPTQAAYAALNKVRVRAGLSELDGLTQTSFREAVWLERRLELAFENCRRFDLVRTGRLVDAVKAEASFNRNPQIQSYHALFPIPQSDMDANPLLEQNDGY
ncbi:RagB/SusD family nutrient uptake outer membrane protein [Chitinophaga lutea]